MFGDISVTRKMTILAAIAVMVTAMMSATVIVLVAGLPFTHIVWGGVAAIPGLMLVMGLRQAVKRRLNDFTTDVVSLTEEALDTHSTFTWEGDTSLEPLATAINRLRDKQEEYRLELDVQKQELASSLEARTLKLVEENRILHLALDSLPQAVCWKSDKLHYLGCNTRFVSMVGEKSILGVIGKTDYDLKWRTEDANDMRMQAKEVMQSGDPVYGATERHQDKKGNVTWYEASRAPLKNASDEIIGILEVYDNITERKSGEDTLKRAKLEADASSLAKSEFLSKISREMRMPLASIRGMVEVLSAPELDDDQRDFLEIIERSSEGLMELVADLQAFAELESGQLSVKPGPFTTMDILQDIADDLTDTAHAKELSLTIDIEKTLPERIVGDAGCIRRILLQLASNAVKFTESGSVSIRAVLESASHPKLRVRFEVEDTGCGLTEEQLQQIHGGDDFMTGSHYSGLGLGLAISRGLVDLLSGEMGAENTALGGTCFWISLPLMVHLTETPAINAIRSVTPSSHEEGSALPGDEL